MHIPVFPREVQSLVKDLPFKGPKLFAAKADESLHTLKDSRVMLKSLGIYTPKNKKKEGKYYASQRFRSTPYAQSHRQYV